MVGSFLRIRNFEQILLSVCVCVLGGKDVEFFRLLFFRRTLLDKESMYG